MILHALFLLQMGATPVAAAVAPPRMGAAMLADSVSDGGPRVGIDGAAAGDTVARAADSSTVPPDSLLGHSRKLRARFLSSIQHSMVLPVLRHFFGDSAVAHPGVYALDTGASFGSPFTLITMLPFSSKTRGRIGHYLIGRWPSERHHTRSAAYANPDGFIEVTADNEDTPVSEHFRLRDFLTHDQQDVWPKYIVLREALVDKLELIIDDLAVHGHPNAHLVIMSGFRTPAYNALGVGSHGGRARDSRHQFGDAADIYVDDDGDQRMDDLNGDGRVDSRDARVLLAAVDRVEAAHPDLVGGAGVYRGTRAHGPFLHVDVRGDPARWSVVERTVKHRRVRRTEKAK